MTVSAFDVADYICRKQSNTPSWKMHKLLYYCQAWSLVWVEEPLFNEKIVAWETGPIIKELYEKYRDYFHLTSVVEGNSELLSKEQKDIIDRVLDSYGNKTAQWLSDQMHEEGPCSTAEVDTEITLSSMYEYYSSVPAKYVLL